MAKKIKLQLTYSPEFEAMGLSSNQKDYRLCWFLNRELRMNLRRLDDFHHKPKGGESNCSFAVFHHAIPELKQKYFLVNNRCSGGILLGEPRNLDYLLLIHGPESALPLDELLKRLRRMPAVQAAYLLGQGGDRRSTAFFYDFEHYLREAL